MNGKAGRLMVIVLLMAGSTVCQGRIKLVALPERAATEIRLDNPMATLIEEERVLTLQQGLNQVDFSWKGVSIDEDSIRLKALDHPDKVTLLSVSYPPGEYLVGTDSRLLIEGNRTNAKLVTVEAGKTYDIEVVHVEQRRRR